MNFNWTDYLVLAERLCSEPQSPGPVEACLRSAVSRSYYAVFPLVLSFAVSQTSYEALDSGTDHTQLPKHLQASSDTTHRKIGVDLDRLRLNRRQADYDAVLKQNAKQLAEASVTKAHQIVEELESRAAAS